MLCATASQNTAHKAQFNALVCLPITQKVSEPLEDKGLALLRGRPPFIQCDAFFDGDPIGPSARQNTDRMHQQHGEGNDDDDVLRGILNDPQASLEEQQQQQQESVCCCCCCVHCLVEFFAGVLLSKHPIHVPRCANSHLTKSIGASKEGAMIG